MTYRELIIKLMNQPPEVLEQQVTMFNETDEFFYGCTGHDVAEQDETETVPDGRFFLMVNI